MFCDYCGMKLPDGSKCCIRCGAVLEEDAAPEASPPAWAAVPVTQLAPVPEVSFARLQTMSEAAELAIERNKAGDWSYWDSPRSFTESQRSLRRFCAKEDKRISGLDDYGGIQYYVVSPEGALGQVYLDEEDNHAILEWVYFTPEEGQEVLPSFPDDIPAN